jgi:hypothetical protein
MATVIEGPVRAAEGDLTLWITYDDGTFRLSSYRIQNANILRRGFVELRNVVEGDVDTFTIAPQTDTGTRNIPPGKRYFMNNDVWGLSIRRPSRGVGFTPALSLSPYSRTSYR